jgi:hypothetical protein
MAAVVLALVSATCNPRRAPRPAIVLEQGTGDSTWGFKPRADEVLLVGFAPVIVVEPAVLESATLEMSDGRLELLAARVSLFACGACRHPSDRLTYSGYAGSSCSIGPWPPPGYGPTYELAGYDVHPGDRVSLLLYTRPKSQTARSSAIRLTYRDTGGHRRTLLVDNQHIKVLPQTDPDGDHCGNSLWFGSTRDPDRRLVRSPSATPSPAP